MAIVHIHDNTFYDHASVFGSFTENHYGWSEAAKELDELSAKLDQVEATTQQALTDLRDAVSERDISKTNGWVKKYFADFTTSTFANIASSGLMLFLRSFLL